MKRELTVTELPSATLNEQYFFEMGSQVEDML